MTVVAPGTRRPRATFGALLGLLLLLPFGTFAPARAATDAATASGPAYSVPVDALTASLRCHGDLAARTPTLLVHGTTLAAATNWDWNYERAFAAEGRLWCTVDLPRDAMDDIAVAAEHVTFAVRTMHARAGRPIDVVGFSQGGMVPRWSLKYWPDTRPMVDELVGIDPSSYGTLDSQLLCQASCPPAFWQQRTGARFLAALNAGPDRFAGIDYTVVYTVTDEVVVPNLPPRPASGLRDGDGAYSEIAVQQVCPVHVAEHLSMGTTDPVGHAVVRDALLNDGPASKARIPRSVCLRDVMPGVDRATLPAQVARVSAQITRAVATSPQVPAEPALPAYAG